ncbi:MAG: MerR family transcriptional regulator [Methanobacteriota archaeon]|nr:MAG: MerR family transcriptional regulator [Euryarchaeota archaeon]
MKALTVGKLAKLAGVNVETIRYYERIGVLPRPVRRESGYRMYSEEDVRRINFIKHAQQLGFSLKEIKELLELRIDARTSCDQVRIQAEEKIKMVKQKIATLRRIEAVLNELVSACRSKQLTEDCPILAALEKEDMDS